MSDLDWVHLRLGDVATQGAHVTRWTPRNEDALFLSPRTKLEKGTPIRGGIPVVFPWFGEDSERRGPSHGFARRVPWTVLSSGAARTNGDEAVLLELCDNEATCVLTDPVLRRTLTVLKEGARSTVVWTPGAARAAALPDLGDSWPQFLCVESGNVMEDAITLQPGERHVMRVRIECAAG